MNKTGPILVTGGTGFVGSYILRYLVHYGFEHVRAIHRKTSSMSLVGDIVDQVDWIECDLLDTEALYQAMLGCQKVIHAAALVSFDPRDKKRLLRMNVEGTANVVNIALDQTIMKVIHVSSVAAIGRRTNGPPINEQTKWEENEWTTGYAMSKYLSELEIWRGSFEGLDTCIINPAVVLGSGFWNKGSARLFHMVAQGFPFYPLGATGFVDVRDVARSAIRALTHNIKNERIIISGGNRSYRDVTALIAREFNRKEPTLALGTIARSVAALLDWTKSRVTNQTQLLTRQSLRNASQSIQFENHKSIELLKMNYTPIERTIVETCRQLQAALSSDHEARYLPLN